MSGGKETPRQKMIGMMYLVLTALLALNVSSAVLEKFAILNSTLVDLVTENGSINDKKLAALASSKSTKPVAISAIEKAKEVRALSAKTIATLDSIKDVLGREHDGKPMVGDELVGNTNISEEKMLNDKSKLAPNYEKTLVAYHDKLEQLSGMSFEKLNKKAIDFKELKNEKGEVEHADKSFIEFSFEGTPTMAAITGITQIQTEILEYESLALDSLAARADAGITKFDVVVPVVIGPSIVAAGAKYEGQLFMAAASSGENPEMFRNGSSLVVTTDPETKLKVAKIEFTTSGVGEQSYKATIRTKKDTLERTIKYMSLAPTVRVVNGNAPRLYQNCGNFVTFDCPVLGPAFNPSYTGKGATIEKGDQIGKATIIPSETKNVSVTVLNAGAAIHTQPFDVKPIPRPTYVASISGTDVDLGAGIKSTANFNELVIKAVPEMNFFNDCPKDAVYKIRAAKMVWSRGSTFMGQLDTTDGTFDMRKFKAMGYKNGDLIAITVSSVKRRTYLGQEETVVIQNGGLNIPMK